MAPFTLRIPDDLHEQLRIAAGGAGRSLQREIEKRLRESLEVDGAVEVRLLPLGSGSGGRGPGRVEAESSPAADARETTARSAGCPMDVPVGVKCKACGKVHQPKGTVH